MVAGPVLTGTVEIVVARKAKFGRGFDKGLADRVLRDIRYTEWSSRAVEPVGPANLVLGALEIGQDVLE